MKEHPIEFEFMVPSAKRSTKIITVKRTKAINIEKMIALLRKSGTRRFHIN